MLACLTPHTSDSSHLRSPQPFITFLGPDKNSQIHAISPPTGQEVARFHIHLTSNKIFEISRVLPSGSNITCSGEISSSHGGLTTPTIRLLLHGREVKLSHYSSTSEGWEVHTSSGKLKWKVDQGKALCGKHVFGLIDSNKLSLAKADMEKGSLEVYVQGDEEFLDLVVCSCVGVFTVKKVRDKQDGKAVEAFAHSVEAGNALAAAGACRVM